MSFGQDSNEPFSITISAPQSVKIGSVAKMSIIVRNVSKRSILFGICSDATRVRLNFDFDVHGPDGRPASETPYMKDKRIEGHYGTVDLKPGGTFRVSEDIEKLFDLTPGAYTIQLSRGENDCVLHPPGRLADLELRKPVVTGLPQLEPSLPTPRAIVKSNVVTLTVVP
ncbi:MAG TPA: hypothetical protein VK302_20610 [Terriglobales bacterium]|nr:hypothetical protein [Terriglobales bacterium]